MTVRNPFPGMNPFLEQRWGDFHASLVHVIGATLNLVLPPDLVARTEIDFYALADRFERTVELPAERDEFAPTTVVPRPVKVRLRSEPTRVRRIEIRDVRAGNRVFTAIELFSPTNKADNRGRQQYERKREEYLSAGVSLVEIDLLRGGPHLLSAPLKVIPPQVHGPYRVCVVRRPNEEPADESAYELYGAGLDQPLPPVAVPLRPTDVDVTLNLQTALDEAFRQGKYIDLRYDREPDPPFTDGERAYVRARVGSPSRPT